MSEFHTVCHVSELSEGESTTANINGRLIAVFHHNGQFYAIDDTCPHMGASLAEGHVEDGVVTCSWHAWRFRLADGVWADNPRGTLGAGCHAVRVEGDEVQVQVRAQPLTSP